MNNETGETKIKFLKHGLKVNGKYVRVWYSEGKLRNHPERTITIYARDYGSQLPMELNPINDTDSTTDYFDKDKARVTPDNIYYAEVKKAAEASKWTRI